MKKIYGLCITILLSVCVIVTGCGTQRADISELTVTVENYDYESQKTVVNTKCFSTGFSDDGKLAVGKRVYEGYGSKISVKSYDSDKIILKIKDSCFVEPNDDGSINLQAKPLEELTVEIDWQKKTIASQTMDGGTTITFEYNGYWFGDTTFD